MSLWCPQQAAICGFLLLFVYDVDYVMMMVAEILSSAQVAFLVILDVMAQKP